MEIQQRTGVNSLPGTVTAATAALTSSTAGMGLCTQGIYLGGVPLFCSGLSLAALRGYLYPIITLRSSLWLQPGAPVVANIDY